MKSAVASLEDPLDILVPIFEMHPRTLVQCLNWEERKVDPEARNNFLRLAFTSLAMFCQTDLVHLHHELPSSLPFTSEQRCMLPVFLDSAVRAELGAREAGHADGHRAKE